MTILDVGLDLVKRRVNLPIFYIKDAQTTWKMLVDYVIGVTSLVDDLQYSVEHTCTEIGDQIYPLNIKIHSLGTHRHSEYKIIRFHAINIGKFVL